MFNITLHDPQLDSDDEISELVDLENELKREVLPDEPPTSAAQVIAATRARPERHRRYLWKVRDADGRLVGIAATTVDPEDDDNPDILWCGMALLPEVRRRGVGSRLLAELVRVAQLEARTRIIGHTVEGRTGGPEFAVAAGAASKAVEHLNHLPLAEVDRPMLEGWVAEAGDRSADYELVGWDGPVPEEHLDRWIDLVLVMNTAPRDDLEMNDWTLTGAEIREGEKVAEAMGIVEWTLVARHRATGEWAGFHDVSWNPVEEGFVYVGATGVKPEHRGHALGKWLKAAMTLRVLDQRPDVTNIRTGNADSNDAMLGINRRMGYRPLLGHETWELPVETATAWLVGRSTVAAG
ncbi:MAG: GNAT family N-acetyltransferase [Actinomycetota bacterium]|nr:GNAT family N-acetyltransferase [Actinomycetota bacterium]